MSNYRPLSLLRVPSMILELVTQNMGQWSDISMVAIPDTTCGLREFVDIWSMRVAVWYVSLNGLVVIGRKLLEWSISKWSSVGEWPLHFRNSMMSPKIQTLRFFWLRFFISSSNVPVKSSMFADGCLYIHPITTWTAWASTPTTPSSMWIYLVRLRYELQIPSYVHV